MATISTCSILSSYFASNYPASPAGGSQWTNVSIGEVIADINRAFEQHLSPWTIVAGKVVPRGTPEEREAVEQALANAPEGPRHHLSKALENLARKPTPNVTGALAESCHAVEAMAKLVLGGKYTGSTYPATVQALEGLGADRSIVRAFKTFYEQENGSGGTRHALKPGEQPDTDPAIGMAGLVIASAVVTYLESFDRERKANAR